MVKISYSRFSSYLSCPYQHYLRYVDGLSLKKPVRPLFFGSDFHKLLELRGDEKALEVAKKDISEKYYEIPAKWQGDLGENYLENLFTIFDDYQEVYKGVKLPTVTEEPFELKLGSIKGEDVYFIGVIDEQYKYRNKSTGEKTIYIGEHKTFSRRPDMSTLVMNTQKCLYAKAVQLNRGVLPRKVIWDYICSNPAKSPIWLEKSQRFSSAASKDITPYSYLRACKEIGYDPELALVESEKYKDNIENFFFRREQEFIPTMVDDVWEGFKHTCKNIVVDGRKNKCKNFTKNCAFCNFKDICMAESTGGDREYIINKDFEIHPRD